MPTQFTYHEPPIPSLLILSTYFYFLNLFGSLFQFLISSELIGQILVGVIFGSPLAEWLDEGWQESFVGVGYVGLLLCVYEGGMTTSLSTLTSVLPLSLSIALTGILLPISLSFLLTPLFSFPLLHAFSAGAALSSTSLGTTLAILSSPGVGVDLKKSKLGTALLGSAVMDDVVAFILSKILGSIGENSTQSASALGTQIARAIGVTFALGLISLPLTKYIILPAFNIYTKTKYREKFGQGGMIFLQAGLFVGLVAGAGFAGTSPLYGAYVAGLMVSYINDVDTTRGDDASTLGDGFSGRSGRATPVEMEMDTAPGSGVITPILALGRGGGGRKGIPMSATTTFEPEVRVEIPSDHGMYVRRGELPLTQTISLPQPVRRVHHRIPWTESTQPILSGSGSEGGNTSAVANPALSPIISHASRISTHHTSPQPTLLSSFENLLSPLLSLLLLPLFFGSIGYSIPFIPLWRGRVIWKGLIYTVMMFFGKAVCGVWVLVWRVEGKDGWGGSGMGVGWRERARRSWRGAVMLGFAMVARGEIGLLISQIAYHTPNPLFTEDEFLITIWAIVICTIVGPMGVGYAVNRWKERLVDGGWD